MVQNKSLIRPSESWTVHAKTGFLLHGAWQLLFSHF